MSLDTKNAFKLSVERGYSESAHALNLESPIFSEEGFVTRATLKCLGGRVELVCSPPKYHVEIFVADTERGERLDLAGLMQDEDIRAWIIENKMISNGNDRVEEEVEWMFTLIEPPPTPGLRREGSRGDEKGNSCN